MRLYTVKVTALWGPVKLYSCVLLLLFSLSSAASAQTPSQQRDTQAVSALQQAIVALGGQAAIASLKNSVATGTITPASTADWIEAGNFKWEDDFSSANYEFRYELQVNDTTKIFASGHGNPAFNNGVTTLSRASHTAYANPPFHLPGIVLARQLATQNYSFRFVETTTLQGRPAVHIQTSLAGGPVEDTISPQEWYLDASTGLPIRVIYRIPSDANALDYKTDTTDFSNYKVVSGMAVPLTMVTSERNAVLCTATISSIAFNVSIPTSDFDLTIGAAQ